MKDDFASYCLGGAFLLVLILGVLGLSIGGRIPFIPSEAVHVIAVYWIPSLMAIGCVIAFYFHRSSSDPRQRRRLIVVLEKYGIARGSFLVFLCATFFFATSWLCGDAGIQKAAVFLSGALPAKAATINVHTYGLWGNGPSTTWVKIDNGNNVTSFSYPTSSLYFLPCAHDMVQVSGNRTWVGILINHIQCSSKP